MEVELKCWWSGVSGPRNATNNGVLRVDDPAPTILVEYSSMLECDNNGVHVFGEVPSVEENASILSVVVWEIVAARKAKKPMLCWKWRVLGRKRPWFRIWAMLPAGPVWPPRMCAISGEVLVARVGWGGKR